MVKVLSVFGGQGRVKGIQRRRMGFLSQCRQLIPQFRDGYRITLGERCHLYVVSVALAVYHGCGLFRGMQRCHY